MTVAELPLVNAILNGSSAVLLVSAYTSIKLRKIRTHAYLMIAGLLSSGAFLTCYLIYHANVGEKTSGLPHGAFRTAYLMMLASHVLLAVGMLPMIYMTVLRAYRRKWDKHKRIARPTFWIWLYVSVTGVLIYVILYHVAPSMYAGRTAAGAM